MRAKSFMVDIQLPEIPDDEFISKIPAQRRAIQQLMEQGDITVYSLSSDRTRLWVVVVAASEVHVRDILRNMPLYKYMDVLIHELAFTDSPTYAIPQPSLN